MLRDNAHVRWVAWKESHICCYIAFKEIFKGNTYSLFSKRCMMASRIGIKYGLSVELPKSLERVAVYSRWIKKSRERSSIVAMGTIGGGA